jgi:hypothetical protein
MWPIGFTTGFTMGLGSMGFTSGFYGAGSDHFQENCAAASIPVPRIVLRLRAPSSCPDPFAESLDDGGAQRREMIDRCSSFDQSQEKGDDVSIPVPRIVLRHRAPSSCPDPFAESLDDGGARRRETIDRCSSFDQSRENVMHHLRAKSG